MNALIATYGPPALLKRTLESLVDVRQPRGFGRIIVVENGSDAGARDVCAQFAGRLPLDYHHRTEPGKSRALQWAIENVVTTGLILFLDDDVRLAPGIFEAYMSAAAMHDSNCFFGGPVNVDYEQPPPQWLLAYLPRSATGWNPANPQEEVRKTCFLGANYAAYAEAIQAVGGFNANIGPGASKAGTEGNPTGQETELQIRLLDHGYCPTWVPEAVIWHYVPHNRCSPTWALHREYRNAVGQAMRQKEISGSDGPRLFGVPRWMLRKYLGVWLNAKTAPLRLMPAERRFRMRWREVQCRGELAGVKERLAQP